MNGYRLVLQMILELMEGKQSRTIGDIDQLEAEAACDDGRMCIWLWGLQ